MEEERRWWRWWEGRRFKRWLQWFKWFKWFKWFQWFQWLKQWERRFWIIRVCGFLALAPRPGCPSRYRI